MRPLWVFAILVFAAMAAYGMIQLFRLKAGSSAEDLLLRKAP